MSFIRYELEKLPKPMEQSIGGALVVGYKRNPKLDITGLKCYTITLLKNGKYKTQDFYIREGNLK